MKQKDLKQLIDIAVHNPEKYHLIKPIVQKIQEGARFHYWLIVLDLTIEDQKSTFQAIRAGTVGIVSEYAYIVHDHDLKADGTPVRVHVHMFIYTAKQFTYLGFLKETGLTPITAIPTSSTNKEGWLEYATNHTEGKHVYDVSEVQFSSEEFKATFFQSQKGMKGMMTKEKIDLIRKTLEPIFKEHEHTAIDIVEVNNKLADDYITADIFMYPHMYRQFVEVPINAHNKRYLQKPPAYDYDLLIDDLRAGRIPSKVEEVLRNIFENGEVPMEKIAMLERRKEQPYVKFEIKLPGYKEAPKEEDDLFVDF